MNPYIVFVKCDASNRIIAINSSFFIVDSSGWIAIDSGYGDKYMHAQNNYLPHELFTETGICRFKLVDGIPTIRSDEEINKDSVDTQSGNKNDFMLELAADHEIRLCLLEIGIEMEV